MRSLRLGALVAAVALVAAACGGGDDEEFVGEQATGEPIVFHVQAPIEGATAYPQTGYGIEAAVYYVNNVRGGLDGRPIEADVCAGNGAPETTINCSNNFVSDGAAFVIDAYDQSMGAALPILSSAGIPIVGTLAGDGTLDRAEYGDVFYFTGPTEVSALGTMSILEQLGKEQVALAVNDVPAAHAYVDSLIIPIAQALGVDVNVQYPPTAGANFSVIAATQLSLDPDAGGVIALPEDGCTSLFQNLRQQGFTDTIFAGSCSQFIDDLGADAAGAIVQPRLWVPAAEENAPDEVAEQLDIFARSMEAVGYEDELSARSMYSFAAVMTMVDVLETIDGDITAETVTDALTSLEDFPMFAGPQITCDGEIWPGMPTACARDAIFFEVQEDGSLDPVDEAGYIELDPSVIPAS